MRAIIRCVLLYLAFTSNTHAIVLGSEDVSNTYSSVGYTLTAGGLGSVVALNPYWVLTAAHVVESAPSFLVMGNPFPVGAEGLFLPEEVVTHPGYVKGEFHDDLALIKLSEFDPIDPAFVDASFATLSNVALGGSLPATATVTGYGVTDINGGIDPNADIVRRYGVAATDPIGPATPPIDPGFPYNCSLAMFLCTYGTTGGAPGDSGGAMLLDYGAGEVVAGINSFIFDENDLRNPPETPNWNDGYWTVATSTAYYQRWITDTVGEDGVMFGAAPVPEPQTWAMLAAGLLFLALMRRRARPVG